VQAVVRMEDQGPRPWGSNLGNNVPDRSWDMLAANAILFARVQCWTGPKSSFPMQPMMVGMKQPPPPHCMASSATNRMGAHNAEMCGEEFGVDKAWDGGCVNTLRGVCRDVPLLT